MERENLMEHVRAAREIGIDRKDEDVKLAIFMNIFHPERGMLSKEDARKLREEPDE
jgi:hypothetical protein